MSFVGALSSCEARHLFLRLHPKGVAEPRHYKIYLILANLLIMSIQYSA